jgi:competence protein ComEC
VLAVSGLHVALLFWFLNILLGKLAQTRRQKLMVFLFFIGVMWLYALVTALSPSVLRAVVMFTLLTGAKFYKRRSNMYNVLAGTAFILMVWNPYFLLDIGFQLSFAAVLGIVFWQPRLSRLLTFNNGLGNKLWEGVTASLAAQLATAPLALYYFHQFPVYFLVANLFAVIISEGILAVGFGLLVFSWVPYAAPGLGWLMSSLLDLMNGLVLVIEKLPYAIIDGITLTLGQAWLVAAFLLLGSWFILYRRGIFLLGAATTLVLFSGWQVAKVVDRQQQQLWVVYHLKNNSGLAFIKGRQATLLADSTLVPPQTEFIYNIQPHWWQLGIVEVRNIPFRDADKQVPAFTTPSGNTCLVWNGLRVLILEHPERLTSSGTTSVPLDYIVLRRNVRLDLAQLQESFRFKTIIADASNARWYLRRLQETCAGQQIPFYDVSKQGAFVYQW